MGERFRAGVQRLARRERRRRLAGGLSIGIPAALGACLLPAALRFLGWAGRPGLGPGLGPGWLYLPILAAGILLPAAAAYLRPVDRKRLLIRADRELGLEERLSTAWEVLGAGQPGPMGALLVRDADRRLAEREALDRREGGGRSGGRGRRRFPPGAIPAGLAWTPLLAGLVLLLSLLPPLSLRRGAAAEQAVLVELGQRIEGLSRTLAARAEERGEAPSDRLLEDLQELGRALQSGRTAGARMDRLLPEAVRGLEGRLDRLGAPAPDSGPPLSDPRGTRRLGLPGEGDSRPGGPAARGEPGAGSPPPGSGQEAGRAPGSGSRALSLQESRRPGRGELGGGEEKELLRDLLSHLKSLEQLGEDRGLAGAERGTPGPRPSARQPSPRPPSASGENEPARRETGPAGSADRPGAPNDRSGRGAGREGDPGGGLAGGEEEPPPEGEPRLSGAPAPGRQPEADVRDPDALPPPEAGGAMVQLEGTGEGRRSAGLTLRSAAPPGGADLPEERVLAEYRRQAEEILQREEVPPNYRRYIRDYFLGIGLVEE